MAKIHDIRNRTKRSNGTRSLSQVKYIVRHHSATDTGNFDSFWDYWKNTKKWGTGGYHEIILRDGTVQICYDPNEITNGVGGHNTPTYHICLVGNGSFTAAQEKTWDERVAYNMQRLNIGVNNIKGHGEMPGQSTSCPGINMDTVRGRISGSPVKVSKPKETAVKTSKTPTNNNSVVDYLDAQDINSSFSNRKKLASQHGIKNYTGTASQNTQLLNKLKDSSAVSKPKATSKSISLPNATYWVKNPLFSGSGVRAVQEALASVYFYPEKGAKNNGIDGYYGVKTADAVRRFQSVNGLKADGDYGPATRAKLLQVMK